MVSLLFHIGRDFNVICLAHKIWFHFCFTGRDFNVISLAYKIWFHIGKVFIIIITYLKDNIFLVWYHVFSKHLYSLIAIFVKKHCEMNFCKGKNNRGQTFVFST